MKKWVLWGIIGLATVAIAVVLIVVIGGRNKGNSGQSTGPVAVTEDFKGNIYKVNVAADAGGFCTLEIGEALIIEPDNSFGKKIEWENSNPKVASLKDGVLYAENAGTTVVIISDGSNKGVYQVLIGNSPKEAKSAGILCIEIGNTVYEANVSFDDWKEEDSEPCRIYDESGNIVLLANGEYYVRSSFLYNVACCYYGETLELKGAEGEKTQLCGKCDIAEMDVPVNVSKFGEHDSLYTYSRVYRLPDGNTYAGSDLYTIIAKDDISTYMVYYDCFFAGDILYESVSKYMERFGIDYELNYDEKNSALTIILKNKEGK